MSSSNRPDRAPIVLVSGLGVLMTILGMSSIRADEPKLADYFGFQALEIYKLERRIGNLTIKDLDGDQTGDIIVSNNARSRIDLLLSGKKAAGGTEERPFRKDVNDLEFDRRLRLESIPVNKEVVSVAAGDFNGDGKPDLAYYGTPSELEILFNEGSGRFGNPRKINTGEVVEGANSLAVGDLDRDGRDDLALLAESDVILIHQTAVGVLSEPDRLPHTADNPRMVKLVDIDGDGGLDLLILNGGNEHPFHVRFSSAGNKLGPEQRFVVPGPRAIAFGQIDGIGGEEILAVEGQTGRGKVYKLDESEGAEGDRWGRLVFFGLPQGGDRGRALAIGDLDGDKRKDVVVSDPVGAQVWTYLQTEKSGLTAGTASPGLLGGRTIRLADMDGDGKDEVYVLTEQEKQVGRSVLEGSRLTFPVPLDVRGEPVALEFDPGRAGNESQLLYAARTKPGTESFELRALHRDPSKKLVGKNLGEKDAIPLIGLSGSPTEIRALDANGDGLTDVFVFGSYGQPILLIGQKDRSFKPFTGSLGPLAGVNPTSLAVRDFNGPALIVSQNTFARHVQLDGVGQWLVKEQFNAGRNSASILGAAILDVSGDSTKEVVLVDKPTKSLLFLTRKDGVYKPSGSMAIGNFNYDGMHVGDFDGDGRDDLLIAGGGRFAILQTGRRGLRLKPIASYESRRTEARLGDLASGDFNGDKIPDVVFTDVAEQSLEIATYDGGDNLLHAINFRLFEKKSFRGPGNSIEPRDIAIGDVNGDQRHDIVLIIHDRVLILRQDAGPGEKKSQQAAGKPAPPTVSGR